MWVCDCNFRQTSFTKSTYTQHRSVCTWSLLVANWCISYTIFIIVLKHLSQPAFYVSFTTIKRFNTIRCDCCTYHYHTCKNYVDLTQIIAGLPKYWCIFYGASWCQHAFTMVMHFLPRFMNIDECWSVLILVYGSWVWILCGPCVCNYVSLHISKW